MANDFGLGDLYPITVKPILDLKDFSTDKFQEIGSKLGKSMADKIKDALDMDEMEFRKLDSNKLSKMKSDLQDKLAYENETLEIFKKVAQETNSQFDWDRYNEQLGVVAETQGSINNVEFAQGKFNKLQSNQQMLANFNKFSSAVSAVTDLFKKMYEEGNKILDMAKKYSNEYFTSESIFTLGEAKNTRSTMLKYGLDTNTAIGFNTARSALGITTDEDFALMTENQRNALIELTKTYKEGMESIDPDKLKAYNEQVQEFQLLQAKFSIELKTTVMKLLAESDSLPRLMENAGEILEHIIDILDSPTAHFVFDTFINFLDSFFAVLEKITGVFSGLFGGGGNTTNNNTTNIYANSSTSISDITTAIAMGSNYN